MSSAVIVANGDVYSETLGEAFVVTFEALGGSNLAFEFAAPDGSDAAAVIATALSYGEPNVLYLPGFPDLGEPLIEGARLEPALDGTTLASTDGMLDVVNLLPIETECMLFTVPDTSFMDSAAYADFAAAYLAEFGEDTLTPLSGCAYYCANVLLAGVEAVGVVDGDNALHVGRQALRDVLYATSGYDGLTGTITCNPYGDCATTEFVILMASAGVLVPAP